ncbi:CHAD domain-containing protein [Chitinophaga sp. CF118]|nr:CHAD domain-containing protein [Chitinophaga sp. CF118]
MRCQLHAFVNSGNQEALHKLRVEIKKIKAFTKFMKLYKGKERAVQLKNIKEIFHHAGIIREANINLQMMKKFDNNHKEFGTEETHIVQEESVKFRSHTTRYNKDISNEVKSLLKALGPVRNSDIKHWFSRQLKAIASIVVVSSTDQLHQARKKIKRLIYVHGILHKRLVDTLKLNINYLDQLQDAIGKWHDTALAVNLLISRKAGNKVTLNKLQKEQEKTDTTIHAISDGFWDKVKQEDIK